MDFGRKSKSISFIGLFFFASISLHSFAHIDESPLSQETELECLTCHNEFSSDVEVYVFIPNENSLFFHVVSQKIVIYGLTFSILYQLILLKKIKYIDLID